MNRWRDTHAYKRQRRDCSSEMSRPAERLSNRFEAFCGFYRFVYFLIINSSRVIVAIVTRRVIVNGAAPC